jgi:hypothetical protein
MSGRLRARKQATGVTRGTSGAVKGRRRRDCAKCSGRAGTRRPVAAFDQARRPGRREVHA